MLLHRQEIQSCVDTQAVRLSRNGQCVRIDQDTLDIIGGDLATRRIEGGVDPVHGYGIVRQAESLLVGPQITGPVLGPGRGPLANAGMIPVSVQSLRQQNLTGARFRLGSTDSKSVA